MNDFTRDEFEWLLTLTQGAIEKNGELMQYLQGEQAEKTKKRIESFLAIREKITDKLCSNLERKEDEKTKSKGGGLRFRQKTG